MRSLIQSGFSGAGCILRGAHDRLVAPTLTTAAQVSGATIIFAVL
jgi:hypothetical protein